ncbi:hypothetical protein C0J52_07019 [Blattella germanica]|nr:hypothetical protein C0J52_07019 [Blattella germanica]
MCIVIVHPCRIELSTQSIMGNSVQPTQVFSARLRMEQGVGDAKKKKVTAFRPHILKKKKKKRVQKRENGKKKQFSLGFGLFFEKNQRNSQKIHFQVFILDSKLDLLPEIYTDPLDIVQLFILYNAGKHKFEPAYIQSKYFKPNHFLTNKQTNNQSINQLVNRIFLYFLIQQAEPAQTRQQK